MLLAEETEARRAGDGGHVIGGGAGVGWGAVAGDGGRVMGGQSGGSGEVALPTSASSLSQNSPASWRAELNHVLAQDAR